MQTVLDTSNPHELREAGDIDLSKDEDNVTSLAVGQKRGSATLVYAGVNSSPADIEQGKNRHFRILELQGSTESKDGVSGKVGTCSFQEISRIGIFGGSEKYTYQRVTRLSKPYAGYAQLGAVTTGEAKEAQVALFDTSATSPPKSRGTLKSNKEAQDVDIIQTGDDEYMFAYCDVHDIYTKTISSQADDEEPECIYITPATRTPEQPTVPSFRALRWLTKDFLIMLTNIHSTGGVVLQILRTPPSGKGQSRIVQSHRLPDSIKKATGMAVANLTPPLTPSAAQGYSQFVIAVAGQNSSILLFKVDLQVEMSISMVTSIKPFRTFKNAHPSAITDLAFSNFTPPTHPVTANTPPQNLKLASVSVAQTVLVYDIPLFPVPLSVKRGQSKSPRYVVALPSTVAAFGATIMLSVIGVALAAIFIQGIFEIRGTSPSYLGVRSRLPVVWQEALGRPYQFPEGYNISNTISSDIAKATEYVAEAIGSSGSALRLPEFFEKLRQGAVDGTVVLSGTGGGKGEIEARFHDEGTQGPHGGKTWDELGHEQQQAWKAKLKDAGHWAEGMSETILKGVVFGEIAGAVAHAVAGG